MDGHAAEKIYTMLLFQLYANIKVSWLIAALIQHQHTRAGGDVMPVDRHAIQAAGKIDVRLQRLEILFTGFELSKSAVNDDRHR